MKRLVVIIGLLLLTGCGHRDPETCDGSDKRTLNRGKWDQSMQLAGCGAREIKP